LIKEEQAEAGRAWEMEFTEDVLKKFRIDEAQVRRLLERYERDKRRAHANSSAMSKQDKRR
jgi:hypothetical protein